MLAGARVQAVEISWEQARVKIEDAIDSHIYLNRANTRGDVWYALGKVTACAAELYTLLAALRGSRAYVYRYTEQVLSPEEQAVLCPVVASKAFATGSETRCTRSVGLDPLRLAASGTQSWSFIADPGG
jgi:hypothetical protein